MTRDPDPIDFDDIIASWRAEGGVPEWPREDIDDRGHRTDTDDRAPAAAPDSEPRDERAQAPADPPDGPRPAEPPDPLADEHFVPPEPPPMPRMGPPMLVGLTLIGLGLLLVTTPGWLGVPQVYGLPLGLVGIAAGLGWLVLRLWPDRDDGEPPPLYLDDPDDPDGGAVL